MKERRRKDCEKEKKHTSSGQKKTSTTAKSNKKGKRKKKKTERASDQLCPMTATKVTKKDNDFFPGKLRAGKKTGDFFGKATCA